MKILWRHLRVGYASFLLYLDMFPVGLIVADVVRFYLERGIGFALVWKFSLVRIKNAPWVPGLIILVGVLIVPLSAAYLRVRFANSLPGVKARHNWFVRFGHVFLCVLMGAGWVVTVSMQTALGYKLTPQGLVFAFSSYYQDVLHSSLSLWTLVVGGLVGLGVEMFILGRRMPLVSRLKEHQSNLFLLDLHDDLRPSGGRRARNFNSASVAPGIVFIDRAATRTLRKYERLVPGSFECKLFLQGLRDECQGMLKRLFLRTPEPSGFSVSIFPGTSRALEAALCRLRDVNTVIVSPYEHPTEEKVVMWHSKVTGRNPVVLRFDVEDFKAPWNVQREKLLAKIKLEVDRAKGSTVLVLSEICYFSGLIIPIPELVQELRRSGYGRDRLRVIIDGAHCAGNSVRLDGLSECDAYVISAHKWLYAPLPCGALFEKCMEQQGLNPYDGWGARLPVSTASAQMIAGLHASLSFVEKFEKDIRRRSAELRDRFCDSLSKDFEVLGRDSGLERSFMLAIAPTGSNGWDPHLANLNAELKRGKMSVGILPIRSQTWLRISFPYFLDAKDVRDLQRALSRCVSGTPK